MLYYLGLSLFWSNGSDLCDGGDSVADGDGFSLESISITTYYLVYLDFVA